MKRIKALFLGLVFLCGVYFLLKIYFLQPVIEKTLQGLTGCKVVSENINLNLYRSTVQIQDLLILNSPEFHERIMFDISSLDVDFNVVALLKKETHLNKVKIDIKEVVVVKKSNGSLNLNELTVLKADKRGVRPAELATEEIPILSIEVLSLTIDKLVFIDYTLNPKGVRKEYVLNIEEKIQNVDNTYLVVRLIVAQAIKKAAIANTLDINVERLTTPLKNIVGYSGNVIKGTVATLSKPLSPKGNSV